MSNSLYPDQLDNITATELRTAPFLASVLNAIQSTIGVTGDFNFGTGGGVPGLYNVLDYGIRADGVTDDTDAWNSLFALIALEGGGTALLPPDHHSVCLGALTPMPFGTGGVNPPLRITGGGSSTNAWLTSGVAGASILDLQYPGSANPAKIDCRGIGVLEIDHLSIISGGSDDYPFFQTTNTNVHIHDNWISGHSANSGTSCVQDALVMGGVTTGSFPYGLQTGAAFAPFQGYLTVIERNAFDKIRTGVLLRSAANDLFISANVWSTTCGGDATHGAITLYDPTLHPTGNVISANIIEVVNYPYGIVFGSHADGNLLIGNGIADGGVGFIAPFYDEAGNQNNAAAAVPNVVNVTANYNALPGDVVLTTGASYTITLPTPNLGYQVTAKKTDSSGTVAVTASSGLIDGAAFVALSTQYQFYTLVADGTNWNIVAIGT